MSNPTNGQLIKKTEPLISEQEPLIVLTRDEQANLKGGCGCTTNDKRVKRVISISYSYP